MACTAQSLLAKAEPAYGNCSDRDLRVIRAFRACSYSAGNIIPPGSQYGSGGTHEFDLTVLALTSYNIVWGTNDLSVTICGVSYPSTGAGTTTTVFTGSCTLMQFFGTFGGTTVTVKVTQTKAIPIPSGFTFTLFSGSAAIAGWAVAPSPPVKITEVWTSSDNITFSLQQTVNPSGTQSAQIPAPAVGSNLYAKIRWGDNAGNYGGFTSSLLVNGVVADWVKRVGANGEAAPGSNTVSAMNTFVLSLVSASIDSLMYYVVCLVPDNLIAAITPLYKPLGNDPATNHGFVAGDLTVNGLQGSAVKWLDSGINPAGSIGNSASTSAGMSAYMSGSPATGTFLLMGETNSTGGSAIDFLWASETTLWAYMYSNAANQGGFSVNVGAVFRGFVSTSRTSGTAAAVYSANSVTPFSTLATLVSGGQSMNTYTIALLGQNNQNSFTGTIAQLSFCAIHHGLSSVQTQALYNAVQALRTAFGGGFA